MWRSSAVAALLAGGILASAPVEASSLLPADALQAAREGLEHLYESDYIAAEVDFERVRALLPESPAADFLLGGIDWHLLTTGPQGFSAGGDAEKSFFARMDAAIEAGEARVEQAPEDAASRFFLGGAYGYKARYLAVQEKWLDAYKTGRKGVDHLEKVVEQRPDLDDAYLGLGIYHYYADVLPSVLKFFAKFVGMNGDRERGLRELRRALEHGELVSVEAQFFLAELYTSFEEDDETAYGYSRDLRERYPANELFAWLHARVLDGLHASREAVAIWQSLLAEPRSNRMAGFLRYRIARSQLFGGDFSGAKERLAEDLEYGRLGSRRISMWGRVRYGVCLDFFGEHEAALKQYELAHELDASDQAKDRAAERMQAARRDAAVVSLPELEEMTRVLVGTTAFGETEIRRVEDLVTTPSRGLSKTEKLRYFDILGDLARARLARADAAGCLAAIDRALRGPEKPAKESRAMLHELAARAHLRLADFDGAESALSKAIGSSAGDRRKELQEEREFVRALANAPARPVPLANSPIVVPDRGELTVELELQDARTIPFARDGAEWRLTAPLPDGEVVYRIRSDGDRYRQDRGADELRRIGSDMWSVRSAPVDGLGALQTSPSP